MVDVYYGISLDTTNTSKTTTTDIKTATEDASLSQTTRDKEDSNW
jgi:hypothetical protein